MQSRLLRSRRGTCELLQYIRGCPDFVVKYLMTERRFGVRISVPAFFVQILHVPLVHGWVFSHSLKTCLLSELISLN